MTAPATPVIDKDSSAVLREMDDILERASSIRLGNALVAQLYAHTSGQDGKNDKNRNRRAALIEMLRRLDRLERQT